MEKVPLGSSGIQVTRFCLGTWNINSGSAGWGPGDEKASHELIHHALDGGCNFLDTARAYGDSEEIVGRALEGRRKDVVIATKRVHCPPEELGEAVETSLTNLKTDYIDLYICHWPSPSQPLEAFFEELAKQRDAGKVRALGASNFNLAQLKVAAQYGVTSLQPPFSILWRVADEVLDFCRESDIAVTPYSPLAQGLLTGRYTKGDADITGPRKSNALFSERLFPQARKVAEAVDEVAREMGATPSQVALAWALRTPGVTCPIVGASSIEQWDANLAALEVDLPQETYDQLDKMGREVWEMVDPEDSMWGWKPK